MRVILTALSIIFAFIIATYFLETAIKIVIMAVIFNWLYDRIWKGSSE